jgi:hypothetical protein
VTCVVGVEVGGAVILGADSGWGTDNLVSSVNTPKVFPMGEFVFGFAGSWKLGLTIRHSLAPESPDDGDLDFYMNSDFIAALRELFADEGRFPKDELVVGIRGELYEIDRGEAAVRSCGYDAIGAGGAVAMGSLHTTAALGLEPRERLRLALEAAAAHVPTVCPPFVYADNASARLTVVKDKRG